MPTSSASRARALSAFPLLLLFSACSGGVTGTTPGNGGAGGDTLHEMAGGDSDPASGDSHPGGDAATCTAAEICGDGVDNNCDGDVDEGCPCTGSETQACGTDEGACEFGTQTCDAGAWGPCQGGTDSEAESCDGVDNNCDGTIDSGLVERSANNIQGACASNRQLCDGANGWVDATDNYAPTGEICDGVDNDCANGIDDGLSSRLLANQVGLCSGNSETCAGTSGWSADSSNYAPIGELCDGLDNDCVGGADDGLTTQLLSNQEGACAGDFEACDGLNGWVADSGNHNITAEICDGVDNDCANGADDGLSSRLLANQAGLCIGNGETCSGSGGWTADASNYAPIAELCDGLDNDCVGGADDGLKTQLLSNQDGACVGDFESCEGLNGWVADSGNHIVAGEICDGVDNDCANGIDDGLPTRSMSNQDGPCSGNTESCSGSTGWTADAGNYAPTGEICDGADNDCANGIDDGLGTRLEANQDGPCSGNSESCVGSGGWVADSGNYAPTGETCDGKDNDCAAGIDDGLPPRLLSNQSGLCAGNFEACAGASGWTVDGGNHVPSGEVCDGEDNDCANGIDDGLSTRATSNQDGPCAGNTESCGGSGGWTADSGNFTISTEVCDGIDNDCANGIDDGMTTQNTANQAGLCSGNTEVCSAGSGWTPSPGNYAPASESCDGLDNDCANGIDDGMDPILLPLQTGSCSGNQNICDGSNGYVVDPGNHLPVTETCGDTADVDCEGSNDNGCDTDGDAYCDAGMTIVADNPAICTNSLTGGGNDCDDDDLNINPGVAEDCTDGIDNDCDGDIDTADAGGCPAINVGMWNSMTSFGHNSWRTVGAGLSPANAAYNAVWTVIDAQPSASCAAGNIVLGAQTDGASGSQVRVDPASSFDASMLACVYTLELTVDGYASATTQVSITNSVPAVTSVNNGTFDGSQWTLFVPAGSTPTIDVTAIDPDNDTPVEFDWLGTDAANLACAPTCAASVAGPASTTSVTWAAPINPGTYTLTIETADTFDVADKRTVNLVIEVDNCLWVEAGGGGDGSTPAVPMGVIQTALDAAKLVADTSACVMGDGPFWENLNLPVSGGNQPNLLGGFDGTGAASMNLPVVNVDDLAGAALGGVTFDPTYAGTVRRFNFTKDPALVSPMGIPVVLVDNASPQLSDLTVVFAGDDSPVGITITSGGTFGFSSARPRITNSRVISANAVTDATGILVTESAGGNTDPTITTSSISSGFCDGTCRALWAQGGTHFSLTNNSSISAESLAGVAVAVDIDGSPGSTVGASISGNDNLQVDTQFGTHTVVVRMRYGSRVSISNNRNVGSWGMAGSVFDAGIADGSVERDGTVTHGNSSLVFIQGNEMIMGGMFWAWACGEGPDVSAGIVLAGSSNVSISNNGNYDDWMSGIYGGNTSIEWDPATRRLPPSTPAVWLIETSSVSLSENRINGGGMAKASAIPECPDPTELPRAVSIRDGLPPNPAFTPTAAGPERASSGTSISRNGIVCDRPPENVGGAPGLLSWCIGVELNAPQAGSAPYVVNNYIAGVNANFPIALMQNGGGGVLAVNNTFESDLMLPPWMLAQVADDTISKWTVVVDDIDDGGIEMINNIFYTRTDQPKDIDTERLCIREIVADASAGSSIGILQNNLFFIEGDDLSAPAAPYVRLTDGTGTAPDPADLDSSEVDAITGVAVSSGNFSAMPGLSVGFAEPHQKPTSRLLAGSDAIDAGTMTLGVPKSDIDGDLRPAASTSIVDIGHDESP